MSGATTISLASSTVATGEPWLSVLSSTFGTSFHYCNPETDEHTAAVDEARASGSATRKLNQDQVRIWICLPGRKKIPLVAYGTITCQDPQLLDLLIQAARQLLTQDRTLTEQTADVDSCLESLTYGLEEQTWLRSLTSHLTLCTLGRSWIDVAQAIIPSLRSLVRADSVTLIAPQNSESQNTRLLILQDGPIIVEEDIWRDWYATHHTPQDNKPLVQNGPRVDAFLQLHNVHAFCAVPIVHRERHFGWIVAVKRPPHSSQPTSRLSELEFGTIEAGLMDAAASMLATHRNNVDLLEDRENLTIGIIRAMGNAIDARDPYTRGHSERVARYGRLIAHAIDLPQIECDRVYLSGLLHDVGKIGIPDTVLQKPGKLTTEEFAIIKQHPEIGARIVSALPQLADLLPGVLHHHENMDGTGYPYGLVGEAIPLMGRILAVADAYDAMTSDRPYREGMPRTRAAEILMNNAGIQWDERLVKAFLAIPLHRLVFDDIEDGDGWHTDEDSLRGSSAALLGSDSAILKALAAASEAQSAEPTAV
jgi:HD-GYP domain-containing protein (c-di-GMP phosphodiesterase class II)